MGLLSFLLELLVDCYHGEAMFSLNRNEVNMGLKDVL